MRYPVMKQMAYPSPPDPAKGKMELSATPLADAFVVTPSHQAEDSCGSFVNLFCARALGITGRRRIMQRLANVSFFHSLQKHTLRGLRYEQPQYAQAKLVCCLRGKGQYIIIDLRRESPSFMKHHSIVLYPQGNMIYAPAGFAHGHLSLTDECEILYMSDKPYFPSTERGFRYDDPAFRLPWEAKPAVVPDKDQDWPNFSPDWHLEGMENLYP